MRACIATGKDARRALPFSFFSETNGSVDWEDLRGRVARRVKHKIGFTPLVKIVELGVLPRSEKKTKRVFDERYD